MTDWAPATEAESAMRDALRVGDQEHYFRILARMDLLLPVSAEAIGGRAPLGWGTWTAGSRTHVLAFTSPEAMYACLSDHGRASRKIAFRELAAAWPNLEWWLAVNPGLPIEGYLPAWFVSQLARGDVRLPGRSGGGRARAEQAEPLGRARVAVPGQIRLPDATPPAEPAAPAPRSPERPAADPVPRAPTVPVPIPPGPSARLVPAPAPPEPVPERAPEPVPEAPPEPAPARTVAFEPVNDLERDLLAAHRTGSSGTYLSVLLLAKVLLSVAEGADPAVRPGQDGFVWRTEKIDDQICVVVFTAPERVAAHLVEPVTTIDVRFLQMIRAWPDEGWSLAVNPGTAIGVTLPGGQITALASSAAEVGLGDDAGEAGESGAGAARRAREMGTGAVGDSPIRMQKAVAPTQVGWYLERGYDRVSGFVHREQEVAHLRTPEALVAALGLRYEGSPFADVTDEIYVLRWPAYRHSLYRIPYGGRSEAAMAAMEGWVIERAPFRGNGFAPADSGDVIAEFKVDSVRLPHGAQLWRLRADGSATLAATLDADGPAWRRET